VALQHFRKRLLTTLISLKKVCTVVSVKNHEGAEILPCLQASKLTCHNFIDVGGRHKNPRS
jgi:hypothetical protein